MKISELLRSHGADINSPDIYERITLHYAVLYGNCLAYRQHNIIGEQKLIIEIRQSQVRGLVNRAWMEKHHYT